MIHILYYMQIILYIYNKRRIIVYATRVHPDEYNETIIQFSQANSTHVIGTPEEFCHLFRFLYILSYEYIFD
jgi:hypothetical protein